MPVLIDDKVIEDARKAAADRKALEFRDSKVAGLAIRVKSGKATWWVLTKHNKITIAPIDAFRPDQVPLLREVATKVKASWKAGLVNDQISPMLTALLTQPTHTPSLESAENTAAVKIDGAWTWEVLRTEYLFWAAEHRSDATHSTYHSALGAAKNSKLASDFKHLKGKAIANITQLDILTVRQSIIERAGITSGVPGGNFRAAEQTENGLRAAFKFALNPTRKTGLKVNPMIGLPSIERPNQKKRDIVNATAIFERPFMSLKQIYDLLFWLPQQGFAKEAELALTLQALTGQRIETVTSTFHTQVVRSYGGAFRYIWYLGPDKMRLWRPLPLPSFASWAAHSALLNFQKRELSKDPNNFLFPQIKKRFAHIPANGHISNHLVNDIFQVARKEGGPLEGTTFASHDLRRAFVTHLRHKGKRLGLGYDDIIGLIERVTHKGAGKISVIEKHYDMDPETAFSFRILLLWENMILGAHGEDKRPDDRWFDLDEPYTDYTADEWSELMQQVEREIET